MTDEEIIKLASVEIEAKTWGVTEQFLEVHELVYADGMPKVLHIERRKNDDSAIVYFPVEGEKFYFAVRIEPEAILGGIWMAPYTSVCFAAHSDTLSFQKLSAFTILKATGGWNKGEPRTFGKSIHRDSCLQIEPNKEPGEFGDKLSNLLSELERDHAGIKALIDRAGGYIQVAMEFHNGNTMLGGPNIGRESIMRIAALNLEINFDLYAHGNFYR